MCAGTGAGLRAGCRSFGAKLRLRRPGVSANLFSPMTTANVVDRFRPAVLFAGLLLGIVGIEHVVTTLPAFSQQPLLPVGVTVDLLVVVPALFYFLMVRPYRLAVASLAGVVGACLALAFWLIPVAQQQPLRALGFLPALLELVAIGLLATKARRLVRAYRAAFAREPAWWPSLQAAVRSLGPIGEFMLAEINLLRYAVLGWWAAPELGHQAEAFSNHRESGFVALTVMLGVGLAVETASLHLLARHWSPTLAAWLLPLHAYTLLTLVAHSHAVRLLPVLLTADALTLRVGCMWQVAVPRAAVVAIEPLRDVPAARPATLNLARLLFTTPNLLLTFAEPIELIGPYGIRRTARRVAIYLDQPRQFVAAVGCFN